jgi:hypothetical protein
LAKFDIECVLPNGTRTCREVQVFLPKQNEDGEWVSGEVDYQQKLDDDREYGVSRLFSTKALRSFMELMYPAEIYGDRIRPIYKEKV